MGWEPGPPGQDPSGRPTGACASVSMETRGRKPRVEKKRDSGCFCVWILLGPGLGWPETALLLAVGEVDLLLSGEPLRSLFRTHPSVNMFWKKAISNANVKISGLGSQKSTKEPSVFVVVS